MSSSAFWLRYLPSSLRAEIENRPNLIRMIGNTGWLFFDKILRMGMGLLVGVWVARYLGPGQFGLLNYATAIVALFTSIATLGLNHIVVRDLVQNPEDANFTLGTTFLLQLIGGGIALISALITVALIRPDDPASRVIVGILGSVMLFRAADVIRYWFESKVQSKYIVWAENIAFMLFAAIKVALVISHAPLIAFAWIALAEAALVALFFLGVYIQLGNKISNWRYRAARAKLLLRDSWPLILSGVAVMLYMRIDQIMLGQILGDEAVGVYSAAVRLSEVWYFIPMTIVASVFPAIIEAKKNNNEIYLLRLKNLFEIMVALALILALPISFMSEWIMAILYGPGFAESAQVLLIHVWSGLFVFLGVASSRWFVTEGLQKYAFYRTLAGCIVNIALNFLLIPRYGPVGSAWASVISQAVASVFFNLFSKKTRPLFHMQIQSVGLPTVMNILFR